MLDTSRIVARGYAIVQKNQKGSSRMQAFKKRMRLTLLMRDGSCSRGNTCPKKRNLENQQT